jgi:hypothetical protein
VDGSGTVPGRRSLRKVRRARERDKQAHRAEVARSAKAAWAWLAPSHTVTFGRRTKPARCLDIVLHDANSAGVAKA